MNILNTQKCKISRPENGHSWIKNWNAMMLSLEIKFENKINF